MTGYVNESEILAELYHHCYAYLHGHEFGGTNPTMLKAMAYGCAILALKTPFNDEMLANGAFGDFFYKSVNSVSEKIKNLISIQKSDRLKKSFKVRYFKNILGIMYAINT